MRTNIYVYPAMITLNSKENVNEYLHRLKNALNYYNEIKRRKEENLFLILHPDTKTLKISEKLYKNPNINVVELPCRSKNTLEEIICLNDLNSFGDHKLIVFTSMYHAPKWKILVRIHGNYKNVKIIPINPPISFKKKVIYTFLHLAHGTLSISKSLYSRIADIK